jgi:hypothetical protein
MSRLIDGIFPPSDSESENSQTHKERPRRKFTLVPRKKAKIAHAGADAAADGQLLDNQVTVGSHADEETLSTKERMDRDCSSFSTTGTVTLNDIQQRKTAVKQATVAEQILV